MRSAPILTVSASPQSQLLGVGHYSCWRLKCSQGDVNGKADDPLRRFVQANDLAGLRSFYVYPDIINGDTLRVCLKQFAGTLEKIHIKMAADEVDDCRVKVNAEMADVDLVRLWDVRVEVEDDNEGVRSGIAMENSAPFEWLARRQLTRRFWLEAPAKVSSDDEGLLETMDVVANSSLANTLRELSWEGKDISWLAKKEDGTFVDVLDLVCKEAPRLTLI